MLVLSLFTFQQHLAQTSAVDGSCTGSTIGPSIMDLLGYTILLILYTLFNFQYCLYAVMLVNCTSSRVHLCLVVNSCGVCICWSGSTVGNLYRKHCRIRQKQIASAMSLKYGDQIEGKDISPFVCMSIYTHFSPTWDTLVCVHTPTHTYSHTWGTYSVVRLQESGMRCMVKFALLQSDNWYVVCAVPPTLATL